MAIWSNGGLDGFDGQMVELCGRIIGRRGREWLFHDGVRPRWFPMQHCVYRSVGKGYGVMRMPQWLAKRAKTFKPAKKQEEYIQEDIHGGGASGDV